MFGVDELIESVGKHLLLPNGDWIISLFGEGGVGKTALAYEVVKRYAVSAEFTKIAWVSLKRRYHTDSEKFLQDQDAELQKADIVKQIADQLSIDIGFVRSDWLEEFREKISQLPKTEKYLIVIDNVETPEDAKFVKYFNDSKFRIANPHKILFTTRASALQYVSKIVEIAIEGLKSQSACDFIRFLGRGNQSIESAENHDFNPILQVTEGNPYLIKLVVRRFLVSRKPIKNVLEELQTLMTESISEEVRNYLYMSSLKELEDLIGEQETINFMNAFCPKLPGEQLTYNQLYELSGITDKYLFDEARRFACDLSIVRISGSKLDVKYSIHSLLWEYTCGGDKCK